MASLQAEILLGNLREVVMRLQSSREQPVADPDPVLTGLCHGIESVLRQGLRKSVFGLKKSDYWGWIEALLNHNRHQLSFVHAVNTTKSCKKLLTSQGFGRMFIRTALDRKLLYHTIRLMHQNKPLLKTWYVDVSIMSDKILNDSFMEIVDMVEKHTFDLDLKNSSFLDETWITPVVRRVVIVPCKELGLIIRNVNKKVMVAVVKPNSAACDALIDVGDTIEDLMGIPVHNLKACKVTEILKQNSGRPVLCTVVKGKLLNGCQFPPAAERMAVISADPYQVPDARSLSKGPQQLFGLEETPVHSADTAACYHAVYYGKMDVGSDGGVAVLEDSILEVLKQAMPPKAVKLTLTETKIVITDQQTSEVLSVHSFTETSSCGRRNDRKNIIAYVSGETTCTLAKKFYCHVFQLPTEEMAKVVLYSIADGFVRTVWFV